jgi:hypothetical protein
MGIVCNVVLGCKHDRDILLLSPYDKVDERLLEVDEKA